MINVNIEDISKNNTVILSKAGYEFQLSDGYWVLDKNITLPIESLNGYLDKKTESSCIKVLVLYAKTYSSSHTQNVFFRFLHYLRTSNTKEITTTSLINYRANLKNDTEWYLGTIRGFLRKWYDLGYSGICDEVIELLDSWTIKGNIKGDVIKRLDPLKGPLSDIELQAFNEGAVLAFEKGSISLTEMALGLLISNTGRRPIQISHLRIKDVLQGENKKGEAIYLLNVPRAKQRATEFRKQFKQFAITHQLWVILIAQAKYVIDSIESLLNFQLQDSDKAELPLFPDMTVMPVITTPQALKKALNTEQLHIKAVIGTDTCKLIVDAAQVYSERTGELLNISSNRFRYTTGTRAAREGFGEMVIAELLDHSDTQNAGVYIENIPEHVESLDKAVGHQLARYAQAFSGVLVDAEANAKRGNDLSSRIKIDGENIGTCGSYGFCGANVPIPCYTCMHFQPWLDGPHEIVYEELLNERQRLFDVTGDKQIAAINDRSIIAVADVIKHCQVRREELAHG